MAQSDLAAINDELLYALRNNITDPEGRGSAATYSGTATEGQTVITISVAAIKAITSVTIAGTLKTYGTDYSVSIGTTSATVTMASGMTAGQSISIPYRYGATWIYPDLSRTDITFGSFPRMSVTDVSSVMDEISLGATMTRHSLMKAITVCDLNPKKVSDILTAVKNYFLSNKKGFYNFSLVVPVGISPVLTFNTVINDKGKYVETVQQTLTVHIPFVWEGTS